MLHTRERADALAKFPVDLVVSGGWTRNSPWLAKSSSVSGERPILELIPLAEHCAFQKVTWVQPRKHLLR